MKQVWTLVRWILQQIERLFLIQGALNFFVLFAVFSTGRGGFMEANLLTACFVGVYVCCRMVATSLCKKYLLSRERKHRLQELGLDPEILRMEEQRPCEEEVSPPESVEVASEPPTKPGWGKRLLTKADEFVCSWSDLFFFYCLVFGFTMLQGGRLGLSLPIKLQLILLLFLFVGFWLVVKLLGWTWFRDLKKEAVQEVESELGASETYRRASYLRTFG